MNIENEFVSELGFHITFYRNPAGLSRIMSKCLVPGARTLTFFRIIDARTWLLPLYLAFAMTRGISGTSI